MRIEVPEHVVYRDFASETVVLNLETGQYYGLNPTAARMLAALEETGSRDAALGRLAGQYDRPASEIEVDLDQLCGELESRGLIAYRPVDA